ncbi:hypothetical protein EX30DRAFT_344696 [Ascodesmis nigricans]|uniref:Phospholipid/glycerol acyltransferase domain-containing protein n=1 Tax=Ascodesmis nigricans TaxID=341454 RepID=A0A4S2MNA1_9PEZI|nr:hypothetical protein EX30DRAFT_344696 [Ascodesmis nigricans]
MEKFSQYRDRGTQIAPFLPLRTQTTALQSFTGFLLFLLRLPLFLFIAGAYLLVFHWLPIGVLSRKAWLWSILGVCGVWWVDLQVEGVKRGSLAQQSKKLPQPGTIIVSSYTSPLDAIYLAAIFDPIFTTTYPSTRLVERVSLPVFLWRYFTPPMLHPPPGAKMTPLPTLIGQNPNRTVLLFPEATPTNGRGILRFTPALASAPKQTKIFPVSLKYTPADITTPVPGALVEFAYNLMSKPTHCIRVRIGEAIYNVDENEEEAVCDAGAEALARIGRIKRLNLGVREKVGFVEAWRRNRK